jgi:hypothetical protein
MPAARIGQSACVVSRERLKISFPRTLLRTCGPYYAGFVRQIGLDAKLFRTPVAEVFEKRDQSLAGGAERIGDSRWRGAHSSPADDTIPFQFTELCGEHFLADASEKIANFGKSSRTKGEMPDRLDFPFSAQDIDGRLNWTALVILHGELRTYKFVRTSLQYSAVIPCS